MKIFIIVLQFILFITSFVSFAEEAADIVLPAAIPANCPPNVWKLTKNDCRGQKFVGCDVDWVGRGCLANCNTRPLGCSPSERKRYGDGGCKPIGWCGFQCRRKCEDYSSRCVWVDGTGCQKRNP